MFNRGMKYALMSGAALLAAGVFAASAQQTIAPPSPAPTPPVPEVLARYTPVTAERLKNPEDGNWLLFRRTRSWKMRHKDSHRQGTSAVPLRAETGGGSRRRNYRPRRPGPQLAHSLQEQ